VRSNGEPATRGIHRPRRRHPRREGAVCAPDNGTQGLCGSAACPSRGALVGVWKEFKHFALKGSVIDLAVGIIIGAAFGTIVKSAVDDIIMPPVGLALGGADYSDRFVVLREGNASALHNTPAQAKAAGYVTLNYGLFVNNILTFLIVAWAVFLLVQAVNRARRKKKEPAPEVKEKACPFCFKDIAILAKRCPFCTSELTPDRTG
jgi:large conductance mechanosensitive channel